MDVLADQMNFLVSNPLLSVCFEIEFFGPNHAPEIIASILNDGVSPKTNQRILKTETVEGNSSH